jgi:CheY-like chemotaxis protein
MDRKTQARLFEPFFTTKPSREGKGLGMSMVYGIVKNHEGAILVDSELGKGSKITIYLPRFKADSPSPKSIDVSSSQTPVVLLVDDETIIRSVGERMLKKGGFDVVLAENGKKAVELYRQHQDTIDVVLLDLVMPEMDGEQTYRALKQINPRVKVVMTSGYAPEDRPNWIALQENFFLQKPFQTEKLVEAIQKVLQENNGKE